MKHRIITPAALVSALAAGMLLGTSQELSAAQAKKQAQQQAQQQAQPPAAPEGSPVAPQPRVKSQKEAEAVMAILKAPDPDARIKACNELVQKFSDSEFKPLALFFAAVSYQQKNDIDRMIVYAERTLEADPNHYQAMLMLAGAIAQRTREFDLDREEKLKVAEGYANKALDILKTAPRPNPGITDDQWAAAKKDFEAQAHEAFALAALARNQPDKAVEEFKLTLATANEPDPSTMVRLAAAYTKGNKFDDAISTLDKVLAMANLHPQVRSVAQAERQRAVQLKAKAAEEAAK